MQERAGVEVLDDPGAATRCRGTSGSAGPDRHCGAGDRRPAPRVTLAERAYLAAEADVLEQAAAAAKTVLDEHEKRTAELLAELEKHDGIYVPAAELAAARRTPTSPPWVGRLWTRPRGDALREDVARAETRVWIVRGLAAGRDPHAELVSRASLNDSTVHGLPIPELYPECAWGPDALVPAPAYQRQTEVAAVIRAEAEQDPRLRSEDTCMTDDHPLGNLMLASTDALSKSSTSTTFSPATYAAQRRPHDSAHAPTSKPTSTTSTPSSPPWASTTAADFPDQDDESLGDGGRTAQTVALELRAKQVEMGKYFRSVRVRALPEEEWRAFYEKHRKDLEDGKRLPAMWDELIIACAIAPAFTPETIRAFRKKASHTAVDVDRDGRLDGEHRVGCVHPKIVALLGRPEAHAARPVEYAMKGPSRGGS